MNEITRVDADDQRSVSTQAAVEPGSMLTMIMTAARDPTIDVGKLQAMLSMQIQLEDRQATRAYNQALGRVTRKIPRVPRNGRIELGQGKGSIPFAKWEDMDALIRPILNEEGFTLSFTSEEKQGGGAVVTARLLHPDGHSETASVPLPLDTGPGRNNIQAMGSTISYGRRYCAEMLLNIVREGADDDGKSGGTRYVTDDQAMQIESLLQATKSDRAGFMQHFEINSLLELKVELFNVAMNMLRQKQAKQAKAQESAS